MRPGMNWIRRRRLMFAGKEGLLFMASEQKRTTSDEEVDKILAELGIGGSPAPKAPSAAPQRASGSRAEKKPAAPAGRPAQPPARQTAQKQPSSSGSGDGFRFSPIAADEDAQSGDDFRIDVSAFDDIKRDEDAPAPRRAQKTASAPSRSQPRRSARPQGAKPSQGAREAASRRQSSSGTSRKSQTTGSYELNVSHRPSHLKDELEKMAVSSSQTGQLTQQLRAGRRLEEITAPIAAQQRNAYQPSERVKKAAAFAAAGASEAPQRKSIGRVLSGWLAAIIIVALIFFVIFRFVIQVIGIEGSSMSPALEQGDRIIVSDLFYTPEQGDIVIISDNNILGKQLVKRVIATGGQTVEVTEEGDVLVDGAVLDEHYLTETTQSPGDMTYPVTVPEGQVFVMGDNRAQSLDSRDTVIGLIDEADIEGRVLFRFYPFGSFGGVD